MPCRKRMREARRILLCGLLTFLGLQVLAAAALEMGFEEVRDPEFAAKERRLLERLHESPERPLILMLGSSRTALGFDAERLSTKANDSFLAFNFGLAGGGPLLHHICLQRLLADGVRPDHLLVEVLPPFLSQPARRTLEEEWLRGSRLTLGEVASLSLWHNDPSRLWQQCGLSRCLPWVSYRTSFRQVFFPKGWDPAIDPARLPVPDTYGWISAFADGISANERVRRTAIAEQQYGHLTREWLPSLRSVQAIQELIDLCRRENIPVTLVLMPEGKEFRSLYSSAFRTGLEALLTDLGRRTGVPVIDARLWVEDGDFWDAHHMLPIGAAVFTDRLANEVNRQRIRIASQDNR